MRNTLMIFTATVLIAGAGFAQNKSESVENILKELAAYNTATPETATSTDFITEAIPVAEVDSVPSMADEEDAPKSSRWSFWGKKDKDAAPAEDAEDMVAESDDETIPMESVDLDAIAKTSQEQVIGKEFAESQQGIADVVKIAPENLAARMYRTTLKERDHRRVEVNGMKAVDAAWSTELMLRSYALADDAYGKMDLSDVTKPVSVENLFPQVDFPKGSSAIYQPKMKILFVRNTAENFEVLEAILDAMAVLKEADDGDQVEIEAKFVEVSEGTLEALGFQWNLTAPRTVGGGTDTTFNDGASGLFANALRGSPTGSSPTLPFSNPAGGPDGSLPAASGDWSSFRMTDTFETTPASMRLQHTGSNPMDLWISALDQSSGADVLSAPRLVTKSGEEATIRVGELHYYPEVFEADTDQATMISVAYLDFSEKLLGVELTVTPEVDGQNITLALNPRITELAGWQSYQMAPANSIYNHRQMAATSVYKHSAVVARLPIYKKREIETEVTISNGSTIGMGGLISEKIESFEDKVPVLGSLPLVGRFFRNEGERAVKRNLLMFVTANLVDPTGRINTSRSFE